PSGPGHIPARVRREVWRRDQGRCQWPIAGKVGGICGSTLRVEFDHVVPRARDGPSSVESVRLLCGFHSDLAARQVFGDRWMNRYSRGERR
ncbi:MAG TPA: HNH endonuclease, partial [Anaeromyxobacteraceae bacterium]|nr:HNH endonuclease [Anaeromyxobacteraceae bacterium]